MNRINYYNEIKSKLIDNEVYKRVKDYSKNRNEISTYYEVGGLLFEAGKKYGEKIINNYSKKLTSEIGGGYGVSNLKRMRQFYCLIEKGVAMPHQLSWSHILSLLPIDNINEINYYIDISIKQSLSYRKLREIIKNKEYQRLDDNTKLKLINKEETIVSDFIKNPIVIKNKYNYDIENISEKMLQRLILEDIPSFLKELGDGFSFIENEYKIKIGDIYNYIDLLLFNYIYNCFIVIELKVCELKKEHIGQIEVYMNYIDKNVKEVSNNSSIGILICKKENRFVIEYCSLDSIVIREYELI